MESITNKINDCNDMRKSRRYTSQVLVEVLSETANKSQKSIKQIADDLELSESNLYKQLSLTSEVDFKLKYLIPLMKSTRSIKPLIYIARVMGCLIVKKPKGYKDWDHAQTAVIQYSQEFNQLVIILLDFIMNPDMQKFNQFEVMAYRHMSKTQGFVKYCKDSPGQTSLFVEEV